MTGIDSPRHHPVPTPPEVTAPAVVRLSGEIDVASCRALDHRLRAGTGLVVVDLSRVTLLSAAAIGVLIAHAERLASTAGRMLVVAGTPDIRRLLRVTGADSVLETFDSVPAVMQGLTGGQVPTWRRLELRGGDGRNLRRRLRTQPTIARALGMLQERYGLRDADTVFDLMRVSSQRHNLRLHVVAAAVLDAPAPRALLAEWWFPGRLHRAAPPLSFADHSVAHGGNRTAVLDALLDAVSACMDTGVADVQTINARHGALYLERHRGLTAEFLNYIDREDAPVTVPNLAVRRRARVVVEDVLTDPIFTNPTERMVLLASGSRALQSSPLLMTSSEPTGVVTTRHAGPGHAPTPAQHACLDRISGETGAWLEWHRRTVVLDALEQVHRSARALAGR